MKLKGPNGVERLTAPHLRKLWTFWLVRNMKTLKEKRLQRQSWYVHAGEGRETLTCVQNIVEGLDEVWAHTPVAELRQQAIGAIMPRLLKYLLGFPLDPETLTIRDLNRWVNLDNKDPHASYFYDKSLVKPSAKSKEKGMVFKKPKPFHIGVVIPADDWEEITEYMTKRQVGDARLQ